MQGQHFKSTKANSQSHHPPDSPELGAEQQQQGLIWGSHSGLSWSSTVAAALSLYKHINWSPFPCSACAANGSSAELSANIPSLPGVTASSAAFHQPHTHQQLFLLENNVFTSFSWKIMFFASAVMQGLR